MRLYGIYIVSVYTGISVEVLPPNRIIFDSIDGYYDTRIFKNRFYLEILYN